MVLYWKLERNLIIVVTVVCLKPLPFLRYEELGLSFMHCTAHCSHMPRRFSTSGFLTTPFLFSLNCELIAIWNLELKEKIKALNYFASLGELQ